MRSELRPCAARLQGRLLRLYIPEHQPAWFVGEYSHDLIQKTERGTTALDSLSTTPRVAESDRHEQEWACEDALSGAKCEE